MCNLLTFLFHTNSISFFFLVFFGEFWQESYTSMWGHYGSRIVKVFSKPLNKTLSSTTNILWWYMHYFYEGLCPICFSKELGYGGSVFVF
jgi:hypothetical protein